MPTTWQVSASLRTLSTRFCTACLCPHPLWKDAESMPAFQSAMFNPSRVALPSFAATLSGIASLTLTAARRGVRERGRIVAMEKAQTAGKRDLA